MLADLPNRRHPRFSERRPEVEQRLGTLASFRQPVHHLRIVAAALLSHLALSGLATAGETLWLVPDVRPEMLSRLAAQGGVVSRVEGQATFVYCGGAACEQMATSAGEAVLLDAASEDSEHFLVFAEDAARLGGLRPPLRLLGHQDGVAVVSAPRGAVEQVAALGFETVKLFRTSMRIVPREAPHAAAALRVTPAQIDSLVAEVAVESLDATVARLQDFGTRRATKSGGRQAAQWIAGRLRAYGIDDVSIEVWDPSLAGNVVATLPGRTDPRDVYIIGGHYDSIVPDSDFEPGADDNASGTAAVLECARVFARFPMASTVRFIAFGGEELGLLGSEAYASAASARHEWITGMFNADMIGYRAPASRRDLDVISNPTSTWMYEAMVAAAADFVPELPVVRGKLMSGSSDHASFWRYAYSAILLHEDTHMSSPYLHTVDDVIGTSYNDSMLALSMTRVLVATVAALAAGPLVPVSFASWDATPVAAGILLEWTLAEELRAHTLGIDVERAELPAGPFLRLASFPPSSSRQTYLDDTGSSDQRLWYRLMVNTREGRAVSSPIVEVTSAGRAGPSRLESILPTHGAAIVQVGYYTGAGAGDVRLTIHDTRGRVIQTLFDGRCAPGEHQTAWDGRTRTGGSAARGVYFVVLRANDARDSRRVVWLRP